MEEIRILSHAWLSRSVYVCVCARVCVFESMCGREKDRECVWFRERESIYVSLVCVCERERE